MKAATTKDVARLIGPAANVENALAAGRVEREKIQGQWLYLMPGETVDAALDAAHAALASSLREWLVNPSHYLIGAAAQQPPAADIGKPALTLLVHELCARGRLAGLALLSRVRQPYLALYLLDDADEVERQVNAMRERLAAVGRLDWRELPEPSRPVARKAWRTTILDHGEWLGLGWQPERGTLQAW